MINKFLLHPILILKLIRIIDISKIKIFYFLAPYYLITIFFSLIDGISMMLLVGIFTNGFSLNEHIHLPAIIKSILSFFVYPDSGKSLIIFLLILFFIVLFLRIIIYFADNLFYSVLREKIQKSVFFKYLYTDWSYLNSIRIGNAIGTTTLESMTCAKYLNSSITTIYYLISAFIMGLLALITSFSITISLFFIVFPVIFFIIIIFRLLANFSKQHASLRNLSSANISDRYNGLLQIHTDNLFNYHFIKGMSQMPKIFKYEILIGLCQSVIGSFNYLVTIIILIALTVWTIFYSFETIPSLGLVASIGVLGLKFAGHINSVVSMIGNLTRLSGSVYPVLSTFDMPNRKKRKQIKNKILGLKFHNVKFGYKNTKLLKNFNFVMKPKKPIILKGRSGTGKTTIANLVSGLIYPSEGDIFYIDRKNDLYSSREFYCKIGYVTQDMYLFQGTLRENLCSGKKISNEKIFKVLKQVDAFEFVKKMGGLDIEHLEAGKNLSGGQKRRLGIAKILLMGANILIFDEITAGLDKKNKEMVLKIISKLSKSLSILIITHEDFEIENSETIKIK